MLPFDPMYKLMAALAESADAPGKDVVRCYVKGAASTVLSHAASALLAGPSVPWDEDLRTRAQANVRRMEEDGLRVMACGYGDLDPGSFDPEGDPLDYVEGLEFTSLDGMVLKIAAGQPFNPAQVLWIHFFISTPFGVFGLDQTAPGLCGFARAQAASRS